MRHQRCLFFSLECRRVLPLVPTNYLFKVDPLPFFFVASQPLYPSLTYCGENDVCENYRCSLFRNSWSCRPPTSKVSESRRRRGRVGLRLYVLSDYNAVKQAQSTTRRSSGAGGNADPRHGNLGERELNGRACLGKGRL
jgi:hypothetical protein